LVVSRVSGVDAVWWSSPPDLEAALAPSVDAGLDLAMLHAPK
jgi:hypothetical protein